LYYSLPFLDEDSMKTAVGFLFAIGFSMCVTNRAYAAYDFCTTSTGVGLLSESPSAGSTAHMVEANATNCSNLCTGTGGGKRAYIEFADKELYAAALSNNQTSPRPSVIIAWETGVASKGSVINGVTACRLIAIRY
jgi:hypothetical protein